ncbi:MAG: hypothetical protein AAGF92_11135 [Myxococcota bacterium]
MNAPIVFIHGTNAGPWTMANFAEFFADEGFVCHCRHTATTTQGRPPKTPRSRRAA